MKKSIDDRTRLNHILDSVREIESYIRDASIDDFRNNSMMKHATVKLLEIIGEASNAISPDMRENNPEIEWPKIIALRNLLVHQYFGIDADVVWQIITDDLPRLKTQIENILSQL